MRALWTTATILAFAAALPACKKKEDGGARKEGPPALKVQTAAVADGDLDVPDPYYGGEQGFREVLAMIEAAVPGMLEWVRRNLAA